MPRPGNSASQQLPTTNVCIGISDKAACSCTAFKWETTSHRQGSGWGSGHFMEFDAAAEQNEVGLQLSEPVVRWWTQNKSIKGGNHKMKQTFYFYWKYLKRIFVLPLSWQQQDLVLEDAPLPKSPQSFSQKPQAICNWQSAIPVSLKTFTRPSRYCGFFSLWRFSHPQELLFHGDFLKHSIWFS